MINTEFQRVVLGVYPKYVKHFSVIAYHTFNYDVVQFLNISNTDVAKIMGVDEFEWISRSSFLVRNDTVATFSFNNKNHNIKYLNDCLLKHMHIDQDMIDFVLKL